MLRAASVEVTGSLTNLRMRLRPLNPGIQRNVTGLERDVSLILRQTGCVCTIKIKPGLIKASHYAVGFESRETILAFFR